MHFASDNAGPAHPKVIEALTRANTGYTAGYGADALTHEVTDRIRDVFDAPKAAVHLVVNGTAANALILGTMTQPFSTVFCTPESHIHEDECNAPEFYTGGAKLTLVPSQEAKLTPDTLRAAIAAEETKGVHGPQRGPVSITQATEKGGIYSLDDIAALNAVTKDYHLPIHMDGARFANALVSLDTTPAEMTWKRGVDAVSFGGSKNGLLGVEAAVFFDEDYGWPFELRRKRGGHLQSKHRYLAAQMQAYLEDDLWLHMARAANEASTRLLRGMRALNWVEILYTPQANLFFATFPAAAHKRLKEAGAEYYVWNGDPMTADPDQPLMGRFVTDWSIPEAKINRFLDILAS